MTEPGPSDSGVAARQNPAQDANPLQEAAAYDTGMLRRFGWFHWLLGLRRPLLRLRMDDASVERIREAHLAGPVVYVLLRASNLDHLALNHQLERNRLPLSVWANEVTQFYWKPVTDAWRSLFSRSWAALTGRAPPDPVESGFVARALQAGLPLTLFLEPRPSLLGRRLWGQPVHDPLPALLAAQEVCERPIQLVPVIVVWQRGFDKPVHPAVRAILPSPERSAGLFRLWKLAWFAKDNFVQAGAPVDLREFLARVDDPRRRRRTLYVLLRRFLRREGQVVRGPRLPAPEDLKRMVLGAPPVRQLAKDEAQRQGIPIERVLHRMDREYDRIAARPRWWVVRILDLLLRPLWTVVYRGVDAPEEDMERIREAMRRGSAIILPSHKSHFDYLLIAWVFYNHKMTLPHVVAGANLAIPVVSFFLRSAGGFFIKRSFAGETLHPAILARYVRELVHHGVPIEFYLEGGRTRSGKLLAPKLGIFGMIFEAAALRPKGQEVTLLPVALTYERVAEQGSYLRELSGGEKRRENLGEVARASTIVRQRLGRVYLRVGQPIELSSWVDANPDAPAWLERDREARKKVLHTLARRVMVRVGQNTVLLPTTLVAMALLAHHRRGMPQADLIARVERFYRFCQRHQIPETPGLRALEEAIRLSLAALADQRILEHLDHEGERVWAVRVERRLDLDFIKNQGLHVFALAGLVACAARARPQREFKRDDLAADVGMLLDLWRLEFVVEPDLSPLGVTDAGLDDLRAFGAVTWAGTDGTMRVEPSRISEIYGLFRPFLEAWRVVLTRARGLDGRGPGRKEWVRALQRESDTLLQAGLVSRPEALSLVTLENTIKVLLDEEVLSEVDGGLRAEGSAVEPLLRRFEAMVGA